MVRDCSCARFQTVFAQLVECAAKKKKKTAPARANANQYKNDFQLANKLRFPLYFTAGMSKWTIDFSFFPFFFFCFSSGSYGGAGQ